MDVMNECRDAYDGCIHTHEKNEKAFSFGFALAYLWRIEDLSP
jgi:hypothetical protein